MTTRSSTANTKSGRGEGDTVFPFKVMGLGLVLNIILDPLFIFGPGPFPRLGVAGAAVSAGGFFAGGVAAGRSSETYTGWESFGIDGTRNAHLSAGVKTAGMDDRGDTGHQSN